MFWWKFSGGATKNVKQIAGKRYKPFIRKFKKRKLHSSFIDNIWGTDLADMQLINKFNKRINFLLIITFIFSKYACVIPLKDKGAITVTDAFQKILK